MKSFVDEGPTIRIYYDLEGQRRKDLVKALGEILLWEPKYLGAPTFSYEVGNYIVTAQHLKTPAGATEVIDAEATTSEPEQPRSTEIQPVETPVVEDVKPGYLHSDDVPLLDYNRYSVHFGRSYVGIWDSQRKTFVD